MRRTTAALMLAVVLAFLSVVIGCGGSAEQDAVIAAIDRAKKVDTLAYSGKVEMAVEGAGVTGATAVTGATGATATPASSHTRIVFSGAADGGGATGARSQLDMNVQGVNVRAVVPGDGNSYVVAPAGTFGAPLDSAKSGQAPGFESVLGALVPVLDDFQPANDDATKNGTPLTTVSAKAEAGEFCDRVAPAFSNYMDTASANVSSVSGLTGDAPLDAVCRRLLTEDPTLWFGIDGDGMLRMIAMQARLSLVGTGKLKMTLRFDVNTYGEPVSIVKPDGATMLGSQAELQRRSAVPSGG